MAGQYASEVKVLIGRLDHAGWEAEAFWWEDCFSLYVNGRLVDSVKRVETKPEYQDPKQCKEHCREMAENFGKRLKEMNASGYKLVNCQRTMSSTLEIVDCYPITSEGEREFRKRLDEILEIKRKTSFVELRVA